jgi:hypothetical protein
MRLLLTACLAVLAGCVDTDPARVASLVPQEASGFTFSVPTSTVMTENSDGVAERIRRDWLAEALQAGPYCPVGYVVYRREFVPMANGPFGNGGEIVYTGQCLPSGRR